MAILSKFLNLVLSVVSCVPMPEIFNDISFRFQFLDFIWSYHCFLSKFIQKKIACRRSTFTLSVQTITCKSCCFWPEADICGSVLVWEHPWHRVPPRKAALSTNCQPRLSPGSLFEAEIYSFHTPFESTPPLCILYAIFIKYEKIVRLFTSCHELPQSGFCSYFLFYDQKFFLTTIYDISWDFSQVKSSVPK